MRTHWKGIIGLFLFMGLGFAIAVTTSSLYIGLVVLLTGFVVTFVMTTAWMRPPGSPIEHHAPGDRMLNDTKP